MKTAGTTEAGAEEKKPSGRNVKEAERATVALKLRLPPEVKDDLAELSRRWNLTVAGVVARLVEDVMDVAGDD